MSFPIADLFRVFGFILLGLALGRAAVINYEIRRARTSAVPPPRPLAWHVHAITVYALGLHAKAAVEHFVYFGEPPTWRLPLFIFFGILGNVALALISRVTAMTNVLSAHADRSVELAPGARGERGEQGDKGERGKRGEVGPASAVLIIQQTPADE